MSFLSSPQECVDVYRHKAKKWAQKLIRLPGVEAIFLSGSLATGTATCASDIDLFVLTAPGRLWAARLGVCTWLKAAGQLAGDTQHAGKICPNHFLSTAQLTVGQQNAYMASLIAHMHPLADPHGWWPLFCQANTWGTQYYPHWTPPGPPKHPPVVVPPTRVQHLFESLVASVQRWRVQRNPNFHIPGAEIVLEAGELRFHAYPKWKQHRH